MSIDIVLVEWYTCARLLPVRMIPHGPEEHQGNETTSTTDGLARDLSFIFDHLDDYQNIAPGGVVLAGTPAVIMSAFHTPTGPVLNGIATTAPLPLMPAFWYPQMYATHVKQLVLSKGNDASLLIYLRKVIHYSQEEGHTFNQEHVLSLKFVYEEGRWGVYDQQRGGDWIELYGGRDTPPGIQSVITDVLILKQMTILGGYL